MDIELQQTNKKYTFEQCVYFKVNSTDEATALINSIEKATADGATNKWILSNMGDNTHITGYNGGTYGD